MSRVMSWTTLGKSPRLTASKALRRSTLSATRPTQNAPKQMRWILLIDNVLRTAMICTGAEEEAAREAPGGNFKMAVHYLEIVSDDVDALIRPARQPSTEMVLRRAFGEALAAGSWLRADA
jgi:hypothetical protein